VRFTEQLERWRQRSYAARKRREFKAWVQQLESFPPQVLLGSNFAEFGGVRQHIHSIQKFSKLRVELAPPDELLRLISPHEVRTIFRDEFFRLEPMKISAFHSHVFPWFIEWSRTRERKSTKWIHTYHLPYFPEHAEGPLAAWQEEINRALIDDARHADVRLSVSKWQQAYLADEHDITTSYLPNGVDVAVCDRANASRFRQLTGLTDFVLYVGRNDPVKNPAEFVRLAARMPSLQFVMLGRDLSPAIMETEWKVDVPANVLVRGETKHSEVLDAIAASRAVVVTSRREGLPTLVLEAMALEKNVVVPREAGCLEAIDQGEFGFVYEAGEIDHLVEQTVKAIDSPANHGARERVLTEFDWRVIAPKLDAYYAA
jgi:glycosyltransferase involved in cell wall biosynthesis